MKTRNLVILATVAFVIGAVMLADTPAPAGQDTEYYMVQGTLQVLDRGYRTALIDGLLWPLIDDFSEQNIRSDIPAFGPGRTDLTRRPRIIQYFLVLQPLPTPISSSDLLGKKLPVISKGLTPEELKELNEKGAKVFKIVVPPM